MTEKQHKTISLTELEDISHYSLWKVAAEATFDVHNILNIVLGTEAKPTAGQNRGLGETSQACGRSFVRSRPNPLLGADSIGTQTHQTQIHSHAPWSCSQGQTSHLEAHQEREGYADVEGEGLNMATKR
jgi:hypothetical protein